VVLVSCVMLNGFGFDAKLKFCGAIRNLCFFVLHVMWAKLGGPHLQFHGLLMAEQNTFLNGRWSLSS